MKKIFTLLFLGCFFVGLSAQEAAWPLPATFENAGEDTCWGIFSNPQGSPNDPMLIVSNPATDGINDSEYCLQVVQVADSGPWVGAWTWDYGPWHANADTNIIEVMVYTSVPRKMAFRGIPVDKATHGNYGYYVEDSTDVINEWVLLTFTYPPETYGIEYQQFQIFFDRRQEAQGETMLWDNFNLVSVATRVENNISKEMVKMYPNPANNFLSFELEGMQKITLTNLVGQQVRSEEFGSTGFMKVDVSDLTPGIYFATVTTDKGSLSKKFLKQ